MINPAVFTTTFLAAAVEIIEMVIIVVGVGAIRGWRSTLLGTGAGLAVVAAVTLANFAGSSAAVSLGRRFIRARRQ